MDKRIPRINEVLKKEIGSIFLKEIGFDDALVTITRVETSGNKFESKVFISVMPDDKIENVFSTLNKEIYGIQQILNKRLRMRPIPKIKFVRENMTENAEKIEEILEDLNKDKK